MARRPRAQHARSAPWIVEVPVGPKLEANGPLLCGATGRSCRHRHPRRLASSAGADTPADDVLNDREVDAPARAQPEGSVEFADAEDGVPDAQGEHLCAGTECQCVST